MGIKITTLPNAYWQRLEKARVDILSRAGGCISWTILRAS